MKLVFITEARFTKDNKGNVYGQSAFNFKLWQRYLTVFSEVVVMARIKQDNSYFGEDNLLSSAEKVSFIELPYYIGPWQYILNINKLKNKIKQYVAISNAVFICRIPGNIGNIAIKYLSNNMTPFGVEVVGDPWEVFASGSTKNILRPYFRNRSVINLKKNVAKASAALYVTKYVLQEKYPVSLNAFQTSASNVKLQENKIKIFAKTHKAKDNFMLLSVGSLAQMIKAPDIVLKSLKSLIEQGLSCKLVWLGGGRYKEKMIDLAKELGVFEYVEFKGSVNANEVRDYLSKADIFVHVSRAEGLPRAIIEAMAVGLPCIGTYVCGIPELLEESVLIEKDDVKALTSKIMKLLQDSDFYNQQAKRNLAEAQKYKESILHKKRISFYNHLIKISS